MSRESGPTHVSNAIRTLHVRTGLPTLAGDVDGWLAAHGIDAVTLNDAFDACQHALTSYEQAPELVFIGIDGLERDERQIVRYLRDTWPGLAIVLYGSDAAEHWSADPLLIAADCRPALRALLTVPPAELVAQIRRGSVRTAPRGRAATPAAPEPSHKAPVAPRGSEPASPVHEAPPPVALTPPTVLHVTPLEPTSVSLTAEELAALLDAADD